MRKIITTGIVSMLVLTVILTVPSMGAKNIEFLSVGEDYNEMIDEFESADTDINMENLFTSAIENSEIVSTLTSAYGSEFVASIDNLFESKDSTGPIFKPSAREEALKYIYDVLENKFTDSEINNIKSHINLDIDSVQDILDSDMPNKEFWVNEVIPSVIDYIDGKTVVLEDGTELEGKSELGGYLSDIAKELGMEDKDKVKVILWFVWILGYAVFASVPGSIAVLSIAMGLITALILSSMAVILMSKTLSGISSLFGSLMGKSALLTQEQREDVAIAVVGIISMAGFSVIALLPAALFAYPFIALFGGIVGIHVLVNEMFDEDGSSSPAPINAGPGMSLMRTLIQWYIVERNPNAFPILRYLFGIDCSKYISKKHL
jgi:hypothetical protein